jgi:hypothetical protein
MPSRHRLEKKLAHEVDILGIAVALAFLVVISVFTGGEDDRSVSEDRQPSSASMQIAPALTMEKTEALQQHLDNDPDPSDTSPRLSASR